MRASQRRSLFDDGGAAIVHANNPGEVPARLEALGALGGLDRAALHSQLVRQFYL